MQEMKKCTQFGCKKIAHYLIFLKSGKSLYECKDHGEWSMNKNSKLFPSILYVELVCDGKVVFGKKPK